LFIYSILYYKLTEPHIMKKLLAIALLSLSTFASSAQQKNCRYRCEAFWIIPKVSNHYSNTYTTNNFQLFWQKPVINKENKLRWYNSYF
jgi:hypothetical protein